MKPKHFDEPLLTKQQQQIVEQIVHENKTSKQIARTLKITTNSVNYQLKKIYEKTGTTDKTQAIIKLLKLEEITLQPKVKNP